MDGASDDNALGLSALSARGAVFPAEPEGDDAREAAFTDDSAGDANVSRQRLTLGARSSAGPRVRDYGPLDGGGPVGVEQRSKRKPCVQCAVGVACLSSSALEAPLENRF